VAYKLEIWASKQSNYVPKFYIAVIANLVGIVMLPSLYVFFGKPGYVSGSMLLIVSLVTWMKLVSYALVNRDLRGYYLEGINTTEEISPDFLENDVLVSYPNNLTQSNLYYFLCAPTLVYQMNYPRTPKIRWYWLIGKVIQYLFCVCVMVIMVEQFIMPTIKNTITEHLVRGTDVPYLVVRLLKLAIPSLLVWILGFYTFFHLYLNVIGELLRFGDRSFYHDWWNSTTLAEYWRRWNLPVHYWLVRHLYHPFRRRGGSRELASLWIFLISAIFHELMASVPLSMIRWHFFVGMMMQVPLMIITEKYMKGHQMGNIFFWLIFCVIGQPMIMLLYYHDYLSDIATQNDK